MNEIALYDYQQEMKSRIENAFSIHHSLMVQMPTGTGKTHLLASLVSSCLAHDTQSQVWIVAHRRELVEQIESTVSLWVDATLLDRVKVMSIQWLTRHHQEITDRPSLVIIDEAHHALAKTYSEVMNAYPQARKIGFTATPCRLQKQGFTNLFDELLQSWSINRFISEGRLSLYDYISIKPNSEDQRLVDGLQKRGADGDYSLREMSEKLNVLPSILRLYLSVQKYAKNKKGIVYAIDIRHAEHIADYYYQHGMRATVISSKTPSVQRKALLDDFREGKMDVLVNVDLFGEGFDCPDVEFIQLARPTLSLAKYLQMVGRGMRVFHGKRYCTILDNVGEYRLFGLPSADRDWQAMFEGRIAGKGKPCQDAFVINRSLTAKEESDDSSTEMVTLMTHEGQSRILDALFGYRIVTSKEGLQGIADHTGKVVLPPIYNKVEILPYGFARLYSRRKQDREFPWMDLLNGIRFRCLPHIEQVGGIDFSTASPLRFYPRVLTRKMDDSHAISADDLAMGFDNGIRFSQFLILPTEPQMLYECIDKMDVQELFVDENGKYFCADRNHLPLQLTTREDWDKRKVEWQKEVKAFEKRRKWTLSHLHIGSEFRGVTSEREYLNSLLSLLEFDIRKEGNAFTLYFRRKGKNTWGELGTWRHITKTRYGIFIVQDEKGKYRLLDIFGKPFKSLDASHDKIEALDHGFFRIEDDGDVCYLGLETLTRHQYLPQLVKIGFLEFWQEGDLYFVRNKESLTGYPYRRGEIQPAGGICFLGTKTFVLESKSPVYRIKRQSLCHRHFVASFSTPSSDTTYVRVYTDGTNLRITPVEI